MKNLPQRGSPAGLKRELKEAAHPIDGITGLVAHFFSGV
jgi:hypothetical protein